MEGTTEPIVVDEGLVPVNQSQFRFEVNLGLALPFKYYLDGDPSQYSTNKASVKTVKEDGSFYHVEVETSSERGPMQGMENDVLLVLLTMASEQGGISGSSDSTARVYYTVSEVCRRLNLSIGTSTTVKNAIANIKSQKIRTKNFGYDATSGKMAQTSLDTNLVVTSGKVRKADAIKGLTDAQEMFFIEFSTHVIGNLYDQYVGVISPSEYLGLRSGPQRRVLIFLRSKKKRFGDHFVFRLSELAQVLGISNSGKKRRQIREYLLRIVESEIELSFDIKKIKGEDDWDIVIDFNEINKTPETFYDLLVSEYGQESLNHIDVRDIDVLNMVSEFAKKYEKVHGLETYSYHSEDINVGEFVIDLALFQVFNTGYSLTKGLRPLGRAILNRLVDGEVEFPDGYRYFLRRRIKEKQKQLVQMKIDQERERKLQEEEDMKRKLDVSFEKVYSTLVTDNKAAVEKLRTMARKNVLERENASSEEEVMMFNLFLENEMQSIAREYFESGRIMELGKTREALSTNQSLVQ